MVRLGYIISDSDIINSIGKVYNNKSVNRIAQILGIEVLKNKDIMKSYVNEVTVNKKYFVNKINSLGIKSFCGEGNYVLFKLLNHNDFLKLAESNKIYLRDRSLLFGLEGFIRVTIGNKEQLEKVIKLIKIHINDKI